MELLAAAGTDNTTSLITPILDNVQASVTGIAGPALLVGAIVLGLGVAWRTAKRFVKG